MTRRWLAVASSIALAGTPLSAAAAEPQAVRDWLVLGPFPNGDRATRLTRDYLAGAGGERLAAPNTGLEVEGRTWKAWRQKEASTNLADALGVSLGEGADAVAYLHTYVRSIERQTGAGLVGSDDGVSVWVNGVHSHEADVHRSFREDQDRFPVTLEAGWNQILCKVSNGDGDFAFSLRLDAFQGLELRSSTPTPGRKFERPKLAGEITLVATKVGSALLSSPGSEWPEGLVDLVITNGDPDSPTTCEARIGHRGVARTVDLPPGERKTLSLGVNLLEALEGAAAGKTLTVEISTKGGGRKATLALPEATRIESFLFEPIDAASWLSGSDGNQRLAWNPPAPLSSLPWTVRFESDGGPVAVERGAERLEEGRSVALTFPAGARIDAQVSAPNATLRATAAIDAPELAGLCRSLPYAQSIFRESIPELDALRREMASAVLKGDLAGATNAAEPLRARLRSLSARAKGYQVSLAGNAHIDLAWLWRYPETVEVCKATFREAIRNIERDPAFTFSQGQALSYSWIEEKDPALFQAIQKAVKAGRWEIVGGTWVEADTNLPSGESLARQFLYGKRYFREKFGVDVRVGWMPDTFGHPPTLPTILKAAGIDAYLFYRPWEAQRTMRWKGPDGSAVIAYRPPDWYNSEVRDAIGELPLEAEKSTGEKEVLRLYGVGDHGGGPTRADIESAKRLDAISVFPAVRFARAHDFFERLSKRADSLPEYRGEINFVFQGCYTSQIEHKARNRRAETLLPMAEAFSALAAAKGAPYPRGALADAWRIACFNQFHDLIAGSGIGEIYEDARELYERAFSTGEEALSKAFATLLADVKTTPPDGLHGVPVVVWNGLPWERTGPVEITIPEPDGTGNVALLDSTGAPCAVQVLEKLADGRLRGLVLATEVPGLGYKILWTGRSPTRDGRVPLVSEFIADPRKGELKSPNFAVYLDRDKGLVEQIQFTPTGAMALQSPGNLIQLLEDRAGMSAWTIGLTGKKEDLDARAAFERVENGPVRATLRVRRQSGPSSFSQYVSVYDRMAYVEFRGEVDWQHRSTMMKVAFPLAVENGVATYEVPFGVAVRPTDGGEYPAQRFVDVSNDDFGVSVLTDSRYGFDVNGRTLRMTVLRSPTDPDPKADEGVHAYRHAFVVHPGTWESAAIPRLAAEYSSPMRAVVVEPHPGSQPPLRGFLRVEPASVMPTAFKLAEDGEEAILRLVEMHGERTRARITLPRPAQSVAEANLIEDVIRPLDLRGESLEIDLEPHVIRTLRIRFEASR